MIARVPFALLMLLATCANAATMPLKPGAYVLAGTPCKDPAFAAMFTYDGRQFSYPHASQCRSTIRSRTGRKYRIEETCSAQGDGTPTPPSTIASIYVIESATQVGVMKPSEHALSHYRWCPAR